MNVVRDGGAGNTERGPLARDIKYYAIAGAGLVASAALAQVESPAIWPPIVSIGRDHPVMGEFWRAISDLARGPALVAILVATCVWMTDPRRRSFVLSMALVSGLVTSILKHAVGRTRPVAVEGGLSWPSGHATSAIAFALALTIGTRLTRTRTGLVWIACCALALSRVFLQRHWPSDVLAGGAIAVVSVPFARRIPTLPLPLPTQPRSIVALALVGLTVVSLGAAIDAYGMPNPRAWAALTMTLLGLSACRMVETNVA